MTYVDLPVAPPLPPAERASRKPALRRGQILEAVIIQLLVTASLTTGLYSAAANWFTTNNHNAEVSGYLKTVEDTGSEELAEGLRRAQVYNSHMPQGPLRDPFTAPVDAASEDAAYEAYQDLLRLAPGESIGRVRYPDLDISLPIYHGTSNEVLSKGVGHLYGSSLPVGGPGTHSVLTAHSGLVHSELFTPLLRAEIGDIFTVQVMGETHWYEVRGVDTVLPHETEGLRIVPGMDVVTLVTCAPLSVNTHRLLVRGERIDAPGGGFDGTVAGDGLEAGFPWWVIGIGGGSLASAGYLFWPRRPKVAREVSDAEGASATPSE